MFALLAASVMLRAEPQTFSLEPSDDIWVYPHASDPSKDPFLRVWGAEGKAVAPSPEESEEFSYSYLKFNLASLPKGKFKVLEAKLTVTQISDPGYTKDYIKDNPLEVRPLRPDFAEKNWEYDIVRTLNPDKDPKAPYGSASPSNWPTGKPFPIEIDLLKGPKAFGLDLLSASEGTDRVFAVALTSTNDVQTMGSTAVYKLYSKDADKKEYHPVLRLKLEAN